MSFRCFAYGSNMFVPKMRRAAPSAEVLCVARLPGYSLRFNKRSSDNSGKGNIEPSAADTVWGVVFEIAETDRVGLDRSEGGYHAETIEVVREGGERLLVVTYLANAGRVGESLLPYTWYKAFVVRGARQHLIPDEYVARLETVEAKADEDLVREHAERQLLEATATDRDALDITELERRLAPWTRELLDCLTLRQRQAFVIREAADLNFDEVGQRLDVSPSRASQLHRVAVRVLTGAAKRAALLERYAPVVVPHVPSSISYQRCVVPEEMQAALKLSIEALDLGVRGWNCLESSGIHTVGDLVLKSESELLKIPNLGRKTLREIKNLLAGLGLHLGMDVSVRGPHLG